MKTEMRVLLVDDEAEFVNGLADGLHDRGFDCSVARGAYEAISTLEESDGNVDVMVTDVRMPPGVSGLELTRTVTERWSNIDVIIMTSYPTTEYALVGGRAGAAEFLEKPLNAEKLGELIHKVRSESVRPNVRKRADRSGELLKIIGKHRSIQELRRKIQRIGPLDETVLIEGENGTGKELVARALHEASGCSGPFVPLNCGAVPPQLLESELFGVRRGAFSGADRDKDGYFTSANGGTLLLDEIGELPFELQVKLLRVLEDRKVTPLGSTVSIPWSARVICATNKKLDDAVDDGLFRKDLYYRINVLNVNVPPLRERRSDVEVLVNHFLEGSKFKLSADALSALRLYDWPGNVRELRNFVVGAKSSALGRTIYLGDFPRSLQPKDTLAGFPTADAVLRDHVLRALREVCGVKVQAAKILGIDRNRLARWITKFKIEESAYRQES